MVPAAPIVAKYLRVKAITWTGSWPAMRIRLTGCEDAIPPSAKAPAAALTKDADGDTTVTGLTVTDATTTALDESGNPSNDLQAKAGTADPTAGPDDLADANQMEANREADDRAVTAAEFAKMTDDQAADACKTMVGQCNCPSWEVRRNV